VTDPHPAFPAVRLHLPSATAQFAPFFRHLKLDPSFCGYPPPGFTFELETDPSSEDKRRKHFSPPPSFSSVVFFRFRDFFSHPIPTFCCPPLDDVLCLSPQFLTIFLILPPPLIAPSVFHEPFPILYPAFLPTSSPCSLRVTLLVAPSLCPPRHVVFFGPVAPRLRSRMAFLHAVSPPPPVPLKRETIMIDFFFHCVFFALALAPHLVRRKSEPRIDTTIGSPRQTPDFFSVLNLSDLPNTVCP